MATILDAIAGVWTEFLSPYVKPLRESVPLLQLLVLVLGTALAVVLAFRYSLATRLLAGRGTEHDLKIFRASDRLIDEQFLHAFLNSDVWNGHCQLQDALRVGKFCRFFRLVENRYLHRRLHKRTFALVHALSAVDAFVAAHFFAFREGELKFYPDLIDPAIYDQHWKERGPLIDAAWKSYREYRLTVKRTLRTYTVRRHSQGPPRCRFEADGLGPLTQTEGRHPRPLAAAQPWRAVNWRGVTWCSGAADCP
ncbi:MAG: hypothetical protein HYV93_10370 [Candidatus Rokubacteria bacterium]|nr:hypothetical protein [Candidatus Rokubacteria bacterium]